MFRKTTNIVGAGIALVLAMSVLPFVMPMQQAEAGGDGPTDCTLLSETLISCGDSPQFGPPIAINYQPPFSEEPGRCLGRIVESEVGTSPIVVEITGSFGGCPHEEGARVNFETRPFFVLPESAIGALAMISASLAALAGFVYFKGRKPSSSI
jgi:hypothetical protein